MDVTNISPDARYVTISVNDNELRFYTGPTRQISVDLRDVIKGMFPEPHHPETFYNNTILERNFQTYDIEVSESVGDTILIPNKTFIRGGLEVQRNNVTINSGSTLRVTEKMPVWKGFPFSKYILSQEGKIEILVSAGFREIELQRSLGRNPIYVRFLNTMGGYSFWLFENYTEQVSTESQDVIKRRERDFHLGSNSNTQITVEGRVKRRYYNIIKSLLKSPEIHIYEKFGNEWTLCSADSNSVDLNNYEEIQNVSITLNVGLTEKTSVKW